MTNKERAEAVSRALTVFRVDMGQTGEPNNEVVGDFLADLMHYCAQNEVDFFECLKRGEGHFEIELAEDD